MRVKNFGAYVRVYVSAREVEAFASRWPCFGPTRAMSFEFDKRNSDLVDVTGDHTTNDDAGILALSQDAQEFAGVA
jgi:hypothetical protein